jgi:cell division protein FtsW
MIGVIERWIPLPRSRVGLDGLMCAGVALLLAWGLVMVASASVAQGEKIAGAQLYYFWRQLLFVGVGAACAFAVFLVPMQVWERRGALIAISMLALLVLVLIPGVGVKVNSARRWINLGFVRMQPSELARIALIVYLAGYIVRRQVRLQNEWKGLLLPFLPLLVAGALLVLEPDFGATVILLTVSFVMLFLGGARIWHLLVLMIVGSGGLSVLAIAESYRVRRLISFTDPFADINSSGWQLANSLIAVGRGEWLGVGLGNSVQKLLYLPEMHTDFIFAILAEEFGLLGVFVLVGLFGLVVWRGFVIGACAEAQGERFKAYVCYGLSTWLGLQALINMAVNMGALPTKGLTLPFMSYGGASLICVLLMIALVLRVDYENRLVGNTVARSSDDMQRASRAGRARLEPAP